MCNSIMSCLLKFEVIGMVIENTGLNAAVPSAYKSSVEGARLIFHDESM